MVQLGDYSLAVEVNGRRVGEEESTGYVRLRDGQVYVLVMTNHALTRCLATVRIDDKEQGRFQLQPGQVARLERPADHAKNFTFVLVETHGAAAGLQAGDVSNGLVSVCFVPERRPLLAAAPEKRGEKERWKGFGGVPFVPTPAPRWGSLSADEEAELDEAMASKNWDRDQRILMLYLRSGRGTLVEDNSQDTRAASLSTEKTGFCFGAAASERPKEGGTCLTGNSSQSFASAAPLQLEHGKAVTLHLRLVGLCKLQDTDITPLSPSQTPIPPPVSSS